MSTLLKYFALGLGTFSLAMANSDTLHMQDFARAWRIEVTTPGAVAHLQVPQELYQSTSQGNPENLDWAIFDNKGRQLPWRLLPPPVAAVESTWVDLPMMLLDSSQRNDSTGDYSLNLQMVEQHFSLQASSTHRAAHSDTSTDTWLLDVRGLRFSGLRLIPDSTQKNQHGVIASTQVFLSNDLNNWSNNYEEQTIALIDAGSIHIRQLDLTGPDSAAFLRIDIHNKKGHFALAGVQGLRLKEYSHEFWQTLEVESQGKDAGKWNYHWDGLLPIHSVQLRLSESNTWGIVHMQAYQDTTPFGNSFPYEAYHIPTEQDNLQSLPLQMTEPLRCDSLAVTTTGSNASMGFAPPTLVLQIRLDSIEFPTGGQDSLWLAVGLHVSKLPLIEHLESVPPGEPGEARIEELKPRELAGALALRAPATSPTRIMLWVALGLFFIILAWMARSAIRELRKS